MIRNLLSKSLLCGALAVFTVLTVVPQQAEAGPVKFRFTPPFGTPFPDLEWAGETDIFDGACVATGTISNFVAPCAGQFTFQNATLTLSSLANPLVTQTVSLSGGKVWQIERTGLTDSEFVGVIGSPFDPVQFPSIAAADYEGSPAWFSLVAIGGKEVQLYWFKNNPGSYFQNPDIYTACGNTGVNVVDGNVCGQSSNTAVGVFLPVPEPATYAMLLAGLGALGFVGRRRNRKA